MERRGFIHDILDVKILILYVMSLVEEPISAQTIYELCYQDDCLSYFDVQEAIPQMVRSGHLVEEEFDRYVITDKGREAGEITQDSIAFPVKERAKQAVETHNRTQKRDQFLRSEVIQRGLRRPHGPERLPGDADGAGADSSYPPAGSEAGAGLPQKCRDRLPGRHGRPAGRGRGRIAAGLTQKVYKGKPGAFLGKYRVFCAESSKNKGSVRDGRTTEPNAL